MKHEDRRPRLVQRLTKVRTTVVTEFPYGQQNRHEHIVRLRVTKGLQLYVMSPP